MSAAGLVGAIVTSAGTLPWAFFALSNQKFGRTVPWALIPATVYLWLFWKYAGGAGWPRATSEVRRSSLRANSLSADVWGASLFAGMLGLAALLPFLAVLSRLVALPQGKPIATPNIPFITVLLLVVMASIVAGVVEEAAFRGYMQGPIERRHGPVVAILATGALFGLGHFNQHPQAILAMLPFYIAVAAIYGTLAYLTSSILPGLVLHAGGDVFSLTRLWATGQPEWQLTEKPAGLIWDTGADAGFYASVALLILLGAAAIGAYAALASAARSERAVLSPQPTAHSP